MTADTEVSKPWTRAAGAVPPPALVMLGIVSVQIGAGLAKDLFAQLSPTAVVFLRIATGTLVLVAFVRPRLRGLSWQSVRIGLAFGVILAVMNLTFYEALARLPIGIAVAIEFMGPLGVAVAASRRKLDVVWVVLAGTGIVLLAPWGNAANADWVGIGFAAAAGVCWGAYILLSASVGQRFPGTSGLVFAMIIATVVVAPPGIASGGLDLLDPTILLIGLGVGLLSSVIPYSLELEALRRMPKRVFGILMSLEPAVAAMVGLVVLGEVLHLREWAAIGCVVVASIGAARSG
ncbi:EamA family transporter [Herbidospora mongoliensis]|uniref:EamA family transporter n=1 Tax=Herbidospora mongoliensis TaxID=688067 RepID=UPI000B074B82|nr:DMT family transporter [Herbidospora mongoliensis]